MIFDSHCHLDPETFGGPEGVDEVVATAVAAGVTRMLTVGSGYGEGSAARAVEVARRHPGVVWASVGVHPHDARHWDKQLEADLTELSQSPEVLAWGEVGLDFYYDNSPRDIQREVLRQQTRLALSLDLPLIIHDRDSLGETFRILVSEGAFAGRGVLYHCYAGDLMHMEEILEAGGYVSLPGTVTWKKATLAHEVARRARSDRLLVETDSPFLTPEPLRGRRNEPCHVALVVDRIAQLRGVAPADVARFSFENACRFLGLESDLDESASD